MMGIKLRSFDDIIADAIIADAIIADAIIADATLMSVLVTISWGIGTLKTAGEFTKSTFFHKYQRTKSGVPGSAG